MSAYSIGQTLLVNPATSFAHIARVVESLGWQRDTHSTAPLIADEPECATWSWQGHKPFVIYTFNPVVKMRVLDVATLPPAMRGALTDKLELLNEDKVASMLGASDIRDKLLGLWAAQETERLDLINSIANLQQDPEPAIREEAQHIAQRLQSMQQARSQVLGNLKILAQTAPGLILNMTDRGFVQGLKPSPEDLSKVVDDHLLDVMVDCTDKIYQQQPSVGAIEHNASIEVCAAPAGLLRWHNELSKPFPGGYRDIAGWLNPHLIWLTWAVVTPEGGKVRYDGLVWLENKWLWLPKLFRFLTPHLMAQKGTDSARH